ncbi:MAG: hypothetical protein L6W00_06205 [Lentisphaeria bacterium]|nr:MAG: hypothetical protein L6W00_06205 [Lentisphaeria bacterium]
MSNDGAYYKPFLKKSIPEMRLFPDFPNMSAVSRGLVGIYFENPFFCRRILIFEPDQLIVNEECCDHFKKGEML